LRYQEPMNRKLRRAQTRPGGPSGRAVGGPAGPLASWLDAALAHHRAGRLDEAARTCRQILTVDPRDAAALHLLGLIQHQRGRSGEAVELIRAAIARSPRDPAFHHNLGNLLRVTEPAEALRCYERALALAPNSVDTLYNLGNVCQELGRLDRAIAYFERAMRLKPDAIELHNNLGAALQDRGRIEDAIACYRRALALQPASADTLDNLGGALRLQGRLDDAQDCFARALALRPNRPESLIGLGLVARDRRRPEDAIALYERALAAAPDDLAAHVNIGVALVDLGRPGEAIKHYERVRAIDPDQPEILTNLGIALEHLGRYDEALACYERALALAPDNANAHFNRAHALLITGRFEEGWPEYEWRFAVARYDRKFARPLWTGEPLAGKTILIHAEQGFGDTLQFVRYMSAIAAHGGRVVLEVPRPLIRLVRAVEGVSEMVAAGDSLPPFDLHCPLLSLPRIFGTTLATIPAAVPYLTADAERIAVWRERLPKDGFRIGIAWQGNSQAPMDRLRSIPLSAFAPLAALPSVRLLSLQKDDGLDQLVALAPGIRVETLGPDFDAGPDAFHDTAAVMMSLDLVIACDTSIAHLAGALGRPFWLILAANPDWRWLIERTDSPWYPTARLFRQKVPGDWPGVIAEVATAASAAGAS
jgi:tetratricopeptide (TPR) repeat protein